MRRPIALVPALVATMVLTLSATAPAALAESRAPRPGVIAEFKVPASNGLAAQVATTGNVVYLVLTGHRQFVLYGTKGEVSERGVEARFGKLGRISVRFRPDAPGSGPKPAPGCTERGSGVFVGTVRFRGERGFVKIAAGRAWGCVHDLGKQSDRLGRRLGAVGAALLHEEGGEREVATLTASAGRRTFRVAGFREPDGSGEADYVGAILERKEGMRIGRAALVGSRSLSFGFDNLLHAAKVNPPAPFSGTATFVRTEDGSKLWTGDLSMSLLGIDPVPLTGPGFKVSLKPVFDD